MESRIHKLIALMVISLTVAVISLPMTAGAAARPVVNVLTPVTEMVRTPVRVTAVSDGGFYVTDPRNSAVLRYDASGKLIQVIKTPGIPQGVAVMLDGNLVVTQGSTVSVIDRASGLQVRQIGAVFGFADGVAVDDVGSIYVVDAKMCTVSKFGADGSVQTGFGTNGVIGGPGILNGQFMLPGAVAFEKSSGQIAVVDAGIQATTTANYSSRVQFFTKNGVYVRSIGSYGPAGNLTFTSPQGLAFEYTSGGALSRMYVVDTYNSIVEVIDPAATPVFLGFVGDYGVDATKGQLMLPTDVAFDSLNKRLIVANGFGNIALFGIDGGVTPSSSATAPVLTVTTPDSNVKTATIALNGTVTAGSVVSCLLGSAPHPATVTGTAWTCTVDGLALNANTIEVNARNASPYVASKTVYVAYTPAGRSFTVNALPVIGKQSPITVSGTVDSGNVTVCNITTSVCNAVSGPSWTTQLALQEANNVITVTAPASTTWTGSTVLDTVSPVVAVSVVNTATAYAHDQVQNVTGTVSDANLDTVTVNGIPVVLQNGVFSAPVVGVTAFNVVATDLAGNSTTVSKSLRYDPSKAEIVVTSHADGSVVASTSQTVKGTVSVGGNLTVKGVIVTPTGTGPWSWEVPLVLTDAQMNDIQIVAADGSAAKLTLFVDSTKPALSVSVPDRDISTRLSSQQITVAAPVDASLVSTLGGVTANRYNNVPFSVDLTLQGNYPVLLQATDTAGNVSYSVRNIIYDVTPPALTVTYPVTTPITSLSGTAEPGATVTVRDIATQALVGTVSYPTSSTWSSAFPSRDPYTLAVAATDAAGNTVYKAAVKADGNINLDAQIADLNDARFCLDMVVSNGPKVVPPNVSLLQLAHGDIAPIVGGLSSPDGAIDILDCLLILRKASGLSVTW